MKKVLGIALMMCVGVSASAQNEQIQNKNGVDLMPVSGEWSIGVGMPLQNMGSWIGNMFGYTNNNSFLNSTYINSPLFNTVGVGVHGKYMISDDNAIRMGIYNAGSDNTQSFEVYDDRVNDPDSTVVDMIRSNQSTTFLTGGYEFRRGKSRVRGIFGGDAVLSWRSNTHFHYTYGNNLGASNLTPTQAGAMPAYNANWGRVVEDINGRTFGIGVRAFAGIEYFIAPKICVGTEFGWTARFEVSGKSTTTYERFDPFLDNGDGTFGNIATHTDVTSLGSRSWSTGIDNLNTNIYFSFYF